MTNLVNELLAVATPKEKETFDKVKRSTPEKVMNDFGLDKEEVLEKFIHAWAFRAMEV